MAEANHYFSMAQVVADAATEFVKGEGFGVDGYAEYVLLMQGKLREEELEKAVSEGRRSLEDMKEAIKGVLSKARASAEKAGRKSISDQDICGAAEEGTKPPTPWCLF